MCIAKSREDLLEKICAQVASLTETVRLLIIKKSLLSRWFIYAQRLNLSNYLRSSSCRVTEAHY